MEKLDMLGKPCPIPVVQAKKALAVPGCTGVQVLVDNMVAVQNLEKMATGTGYGFEWAGEGDKRYRVTITTNGAPAAPRDTPIECAPMAAAGEGPTVLITGEGMGRGSDELGKALIKGFVFSLTELVPVPRTVIFLNGGALLTTEGAATVDDLRTLEEKGVEILTCGTCANYYGLTEKLAVGGITDMLGITTRLAAAARLICL